MSVVMLDGPTLVKSVDDSETFDRLVNEHFDMLDEEKKGGLSLEALQKRYGKFSSLEYELQSKEEVESVYRLLFEKFDADQNGVIDREEFRTMMKEIMLVKARSIGNSPVLVIVQEDSLLFRAIQYKKD